MKLTDKWEMSNWAYYQCRDGNDTQEMRDLITDSEWAYVYCLVVKDIEEIWRKITDPYWAYVYCIKIKSRPELKDLAIQYAKENKSRYGPYGWERS